MAKKLSRFQFYFPRLIGTSPMSKQETFFFYNWTSEIIPFICFGKQMDMTQNLIQGKFLEALGSGIGTSLVFCHSFSVLNNVIMELPETSKTSPRWLPGSQFFFLKDNAIQGQSNYCAILMKINNKYTSHFTLFESENEWQDTEQVPIQLPRASRNFPDDF